MASHRFDPTILREYDIRGIVGQTLTVADARAVGRAFAAIIAEKGGRRVYVGRDGRLSSPELEEGVVEGLTAGCMDVTRIGLGPTPMLYYAVYTREPDGGVMVSGSHNPPEYNGFKLMVGKKPFFGEDIQRLGAIAAEAGFAEGGSLEGEGTSSQEDIFDDYVARLAEDYEGNGSLAVAWDAGNGCAGPAMAALTRRLPGRHVLLNETVDGTFPAHHPEPTVPENLEQLQDCVLREKCDLGIGLDGDGDRVGVVDEFGRILWGDQMMALFARNVLARRPGATIIADVKASQVLFDEIARLGGDPLMWRTGHSLIKAKMAETGAPLAGEMSGHIFFADRYYGYDDALYAAVRLLSVIVRSGMSLAEMRDELPQVVNTPELRFACDEVRKFAVVEEVAQRLRADGARMVDRDGVRVRTKDGWWLLRASNTQDVLVARCESSTEEGLERLKDDLAARLRESGIEPPRF